MTRIGRKIFKWYAVKDAVSEATGIDQLGVPPSIGLLHYAAETI